MSLTFCSPRRWFCCLCDDDMRTRFVRRRDPIPTNPQLRTRAPSREGAECLCLCQADALWRLCLCFSTFALALSFSPSNARTGRFRSHSHSLCKLTCTGRRFSRHNWPPQILSVGLRIERTHTYTSAQTEKSAAPENPGSISMRISVLSAGWGLFHFFCDRIQWNICLETTTLLRSDLRISFGLLLQPVSFKGKQAQFLVSIFNLHTFFFLL